MARNPYFRDYSGEQNVAEDLTVEAIKATGRDMVYIPRNILTKDDLFGESKLSKFENGYEIEMYISSVDGFEGEGDVLSQYGIQIKDRVELIVSRRRFQEEITSYEGIDRPQEGDIIYFPLSKTLFEINFVEHENPFYQLGKLFTYKLSCEVYTLTIQDEIETGIEDIDTVEDERKDYMIKLNLGNKISSTVNYYEGEEVFQQAGFVGATASDATATATVTEWDLTNKILYIANLEGTLSTGASESIMGSSSTAEYYLSSKETTNTIIVHEPGDNQPAGDNESIEFDIDYDNIFDFTETDPFSEGDYA
jgi:hypothetical protein